MNKRFDDIIKRGKYSRYLADFPVNLPQREWPDKTIEKPPIWCAVDLRDGNQALLKPMDPPQKLELFLKLIDIGFKEIEIGFPSASESEYAFARKIIDDQLIPQDVIPQVLVQARPHLIKKTFSAIEGCERAIVHLYNSTSKLQREVVFKKSKAEIIQIAIDGLKVIQDLLSSTNTQVTLEYSPESFTGTELEFAKEICDAVISTWNPSPEHKMIINIPATVEMSTPNVYADQVEWFSKHICHRDSVILSVHTHNDRGSAVAAAELGLLAGAERVEGTLFGYGERTGNVDIVTLALNMLSQGVHPNLDISDIRAILQTVIRCTGESFSKRHPYAGDLVFTAFSGSHQDAIGKGFAAQAEMGSETVTWGVPYLPIDPYDIGRDYEAVVRVNSQSGKGGAAFLLKNHHGISMPKTMWPDFYEIVQSFTELNKEEASPARLYSLFCETYIKRKPISILSYAVSKEAFLFEVVVNDNPCLLTVSDKKTGIVEALIKGLLESHWVSDDFEILSFHQEALKEGKNAEAIAFVLGAYKKEEVWGVGIDKDTVMSELKAVISSINVALGLNES